MESNIIQELVALLNSDNPEININGRVCHHRIRVLYALAKQFNLTSYIEIGVHNGSSMAYVLQHNGIKECSGIDPFEKLVTNDPGMVHYQANDKLTMHTANTNINNNNKYNAKINLIQDYSDNVNVDNLKDSFDLLFIDGDHNYDAVLNDYNRFKNTIKSGGFIVFDDLHQDGPNKVFLKVKNDSDIENIGIYEKTEGIFRKK